MDVVTSDVLSPVLVRIQRRRVKGWRMPKNTVSVTRPGVFGNPFTAQQAQEAGYLNGGKMAVFAFSEWLKESPNDFNDKYPEKRKRLLGNLQKLKGRNLACFCPLNCECHADVLLELANR